MTRWEHSVAPLDLLRGQALALKGDDAGARGAFLRARATLQDSLVNPGTAIDALSYLGLANAGLGNRNEALKDARTAATQMPMSRDPIVGAFQLERLAQVEAQVGDPDAAIVHLRQLLLSTGGQTVSVATLKIDPAWDGLRDNPRFQALLQIPPGAGSGSGVAASHG
jgi:tetratricopeptide (TPR) repeat protein